MLLTKSQRDLLIGLVLKAVANEKRWHDAELTADRINRKNVLMHSTAIANLVGIHKQLTAPLQIDTKVRLDGDIATIGAKLTYANGDIHYLVKGIPRYEGEWLSADQLEIVE